ncbi:MAG TPA: RluA family pseudouridine synthase [Blastocatellia bacterium]|nr:RluA family pseudouridine synthase [Blastocatellia bacterium]
MNETIAPDLGPLDLTVDADGTGQRLDTYLADAIPALTRSRVQRAIEDGDVLVNGATPKNAQKLRSGDRIEIDLPEPPPTSLEPEPIPLNIVYEDGALLVVDKPAGMVVHPGAGVSSGTLANAVLYHMTGKTPGAVGRPGIVHRIDRDTSGLLVVAKSEQALSALSEQFQQRTVAKRYLALVYGRVVDNSRTFDQPICRHPQIRVRMAIARHGLGRPAVTIARVLQRFDEVTLLDVKILTGRTHQIRVHVAAAGHPVVGDEVYGRGRSKPLRNVELRRRIDELGRQFLHAAFLAFDHPVTGKRLEFNSQLPPELASLLEYCRSRGQ